MILSLPISEQYPLPFEYKYGNQYKIETYFYCNKPDLDKGLSINYKCSYKLIQDAYKFKFRQFAKIIDSII